MPIQRRAHPPNPKIALRIKAVMELHEINQVELAEILGLAQPSVSLFLAGLTQPRDETVRRFAELFDEDYDFLMGYTDRGAKGLGTIDRLLIGADSDELAFLKDMSDEEFHEMMGQAALKRRKRKRRGGRAAAICLAVLVACGAAAGVFEHHHHVHVDGLAASWGHCRTLGPCPICFVVARLPHSHDPSFPPHTHG